MGCHCLLRWKHYTLLINAGKRTILQNSRNFQIHDQQQLLIRKPNLIRGLFWWLGRLKEKESKGIGCDDIQWGYRETKCFYGDFTCPCICSLNLLLQFWKIEKLPLWTLGIPRSHKNMSIRNRARSLEEYAKNNYDKIVGETWSNPSHQHTLSFFFFFLPYLKIPRRHPRPMWDLNSSFPDEGSNHAPCTGMWSLNHWTPRKVPNRTLKHLILFSQKTGESWKLIVNYSNIKNNS